MKYKNLMWGRYIGAFSATAFLALGCSPVSPSVDKALKVSNAAKPTPEDEIPVTITKMVPYDLDVVVEDPKEKLKDPEEDEIRIVLSKKESEVLLTELKESGTTKFQLEGKEIQNVRTVVEVEKSEDSEFLEELKKFSLNLTFKSEDGVVDVTLEDQSEKAVSELVRPKLKRVVMFIKGEVQIKAEPKPSEEFSI